MLGFPTQLRYCVSPVLLIILMCCLHLFFSTSALNFDFSEIAAGQWWRIISGQLLHTNDNHLFLNIAGVALVWALHGEYYGYWRFPALVITSLIVVGGATLYFSETYVYYGLSGVLHFLLAWGACLDLCYLDKPVRLFKLRASSINDHTGLLLLVGLTAKVLYENTLGGTEDTAELIGASVAVEVHAIGVVTGILVFSVLFGIKKATFKVAS